MTLRKIIYSRIFLVRLKFQPQKIRSCQRSITRRINLFDRKQLLQIPETTNLFKKLLKEYPVVLTQWGAVKNPKNLRYLHLIIMSLVKYHLFRSLFIHKLTKCLIHTRKVWNQTVFVELKTFQVSYVATVISDINIVDRDTSAVQPLTRDKTITINYVITVSVINNYWYGSMSYSIDMVKFGRCSPYDFFLFNFLFDA